MKNDTADERPREDDTSVRQALYAHSIRRHSSDTHPRPVKMTRLLRARMWLAERLSIRQRLTLWYAMLLTLLLTLLSAVTFTVAQNQIQSNLNADIRGRAIAVANALQREQYTSSGGSPVLPSPTSGAAPTITPTSNATASATPGASPTASAPRDATNTPTTATPPPASTPDPATNAAIQRKLGAVPDALGRLDLGFEVLDTNGRLKYLAPSLNNHSLPINFGVVDAALNGVPGSYTARSDGALLAIYAQPIFLTAAGSGRSATGTTSGSTSATHQAAMVAGVVLVAKAEDDVNNALNTLGRILLIGDLVAIFCALMGGWLIAESGLRPIASITRTAKAIARDASSAGLGTRVRYRGAKDEVGELASTFNEMLESLEQVAGAQRRFVADASHELRAPLTTIRGNLELLRQAPDLPDEERMLVVDDAYVEAERMSTLVADLLLLARVDAAAASRGKRAAQLDDQLAGRRELVELDQVVMELFRSGQSHLRALHKDIALSVTNLAPVAVMADPGQMRQLGMILLDNAIKYTPSGGRIQLAVSRTGPLAALMVSDTGIGISEDDLSHVFERFYRADRARERDEHGSGLGLAIARWIAESHHGEVKVESTLGKGSVFTALLPAAKRPSDQTAPKMPVTTARKRARENALALEAMAIRPLARLAQSVSRPVSRPRPRVGAPAKGSAEQLDQPKVTAPKTEAVKTEAVKTSRPASRRSKTPSLKADGKAPGASSSALRIPTEAGQSVTTVASRSSGRHSKPRARASKSGE